MSDKMKTLTERTTCQISAILTDLLCIVGNTLKVPDFVSTNVTRFLVAYITHITKN